MSPVIQMVAFVFVASFMFELGVGSPRQSPSVVSGHLGDLARGIVIMLVIGPLAALALARAFDLIRPVAAALVVLSVVGVAPLAPKAARAAGGDVRLGVLLTFALAVIAVFTAPPTAKLLLGYAGKVHVAVVPLIARLLVAQGLPLALGMYVRARASRPKAIERVATSVNTLALVAVVLVVVLPRVGAVRVLGWKGAVATVLYSAVMAVFAYARGGPTPDASRTIAAMINMPNIALALGLLTTVSAPPVFAVSLIGVFLIRIIVGLVAQKVLARPVERHKRRHTFGRLWVATEKA